MTKIRRTIENNENKYSILYENKTKIKLFLLEYVWIVNYAYECVNYRYRLKVIVIKLDLVPSDIEEVSLFSREI